MLMLTCGENEQFSDIDIDFFKDIRYDNNIH